MGEGDARAPARMGEADPLVEHPGVAAHLWVALVYPRVVNVSVRPSHVSVHLCQLNKPLVHSTSIRVTTR